MGYESGIKNLDNQIKAAQATASASNHMYSQLDDTMRKRVEQKDSTIAQTKERIEMTKRKIADLRNNTTVENILQQNKGNRRL
jgi:polyhydroxyalkanoate synthesis regulator phasin